MEGGREGGLAVGWTTAFQASSLLGICKHSRPSLPAHPSLPPFPPPSLPTSPLSTALRTCSNMPTAVREWKQPPSLKA
jgi:hypothetical protein